MEPMTIRELLEAVNGRLLGEFNDVNRTVSRVETDSRTIHEGSLFIPLVGERFDGHAYINAALEGGAAGCLTQRERESYLPGKFYIKVDSTHGIWPAGTSGNFPSPWWPSRDRWERRPPRIWWPPFWESASRCSKPRGI